MIRAAIVTPWVSSVASIAPMRANHPKLTDDYSLARWEDITGQPAKNIVTKPNEYTVLVECEADTLAAIQKDSDYTVLWWE